MDNDTILQIQGVSKKFARNYKAARRQLLLDFFYYSVLKRNRRRDVLHHNEFWALKDISFELRNGETIGIMGLNGSGKSTLLKIINNILLPDTGEVKIRGRVGALIELNAGFQMGLSGRENIFIKGAILGKSRSEMLQLYDGIVEFSELEESIDSPVSSYSSGMKMRLGFAIAINMRPDILILDEVLAVGDFKFRQKCLSKINELRENMTTLLVSHSVRDISLFCDRAIVLRQGENVFSGSPEDAIAFYQGDISGGSSRQIKNFYGDIFHNKDKISEVEHYWADAELKPIEKANTHQEVRLVVKFKLNYKPGNLVIGIPIWTKDGEYITANSADEDQQSFPISEDGYYSVALHFDRLGLNTNSYYAVVAIVDGPEFLYRQLNEPLNVTCLGLNLGFVKLPHDWEILYR